MTASPESRDARLHAMIDHAPIGVFDSGVGGLTVVREMQRRIPHESILYLGDTARVPYGTKSPASIERYATQAARHLIERGVKSLVVACNTASAVALDSLAEELAPVPVIGVIAPGARAAVGGSARQHHLVLATESTVRGRSYERAIHALRPDAIVESRACSVLVALAEEGWTDGAVPEDVIRRYVADVLDRPEANRPDTIVLGCTHFPVLRDCIRAVVGPEPRIVDSATTTVDAIATRSRTAAAGVGERRDRREGTLRVLATDNPERFAAVGARFLGRRLEPSDIESVDL